MTLPLRRTYHFSHSSGACVSFACHFALAVADIRRKERQPEIPHGQTAAPQGPGVVAISTPIESFSLFRPGLFVMAVNFFCGPGLLMMIFDVAGGSAAGSVQHDQLKTWSIQTLVISSRPVVVEETSNNLAVNSSPWRAC